MVVNTISSTSKSLSSCNKLYGHPFYGLHDEEASGYPLNLILFDFQQDFMLLIFCSFCEPILFSVCHVDVGVSWLLVLVSLLFSPFPYFVESFYMVLFAFYIYLPSNAGNRFILEILAQLNFPEAKVAFLRSLNTNVFFLTVSYIIPKPRSKIIFSFYGVFSSFKSSIAIHDTYLLIF